MASQPFKERRNGGEETLDHAGVGDGTLEIGPTGLGVGIHKRGGRRFAAFAALSERGTEFAEERGPGGKERLKR